MVSGGTFHLLSMRVGNYGLCLSKLSDKSRFLWGITLQGRPFERGKEGPAKEQKQTDRQTDTLIPTNIAAHTHFPAVYFTATHVHAEGYGADWEGCGNTNMCVCARGRPMPEGIFHPKRGNTAKCAEGKPTPDSHISGLSRNII